MRKHAFAIEIHNTPLWLKNGRDLYFSCNQIVTKFNFGNQKVTIVYFTSRHFSKRWKIFLKEIKKLPKTIQKVTKWMMKNLPKFVFCSSDVWLRPHWTFCQLKVFFFKCKTKVGNWKKVTLFKLIFFRAIKKLRHAHTRILCVIQSYPSIFLILILFTYFKILYSDLKKFCFEILCTQSLETGCKPVLFL